MPLVQHHPVAPNNSSPGVPLFDAILCSRVVLGRSYRNEFVACDHTDQIRVSRISYLLDKDALIDPPFALHVDAIDPVIMREQAIGREPAARRKRKCASTHGRGVLLLGNDPVPDQLDRRLLIRRRLGESRGYEDQADKRQDKLVIHAAIG